MGFLGSLLRATAGAAADEIAAQGRAKPPDPLRWLKLGIGLCVLVIGWVFILWVNRFHLTAPTVFVCIAYLAIVLAVWNLWRTGVQAAAYQDDDEDDSTWGRPLGARAELEREKKTLLKAIKEAEFDREMGKLSQADADEMIGLYRARAIEVIKELDKLGGSAGTVREQIEREVRARLELEGKSKRAAEGAKEKGKKHKDKKKPAKAAADAAAAAEKAAIAAEEAAAAASAAVSPARGMDAAGAAAAADAAADAASAAAVEAKEAAADAKAAADELSVPAPIETQDSKAEKASEANP